ncbi:MAG: hypothetical protein AAF985_24035 [Bacteroidota bacterium]
MKIRLPQALLILCFSIIGLPKGWTQAQFSIQLNAAQPIGEYADYIHHTPMGISFTYLKPFKKSNGLFWGMEVGVGMFYKDTYDLAKPNGPGYFEVDEEDCFLSYLLLARYYGYNKSIFTPYVEARLGATSFFSTLYSDDAAENGFKNETEFHGTAFNAGFGVGSLLRLGKQVALDMSVAISKGTRTHYRSIDNKADRIRLNLAEGEQVSTTDFVNYKLGILFGF